MTAPAPLIKGWCPGALLPMQAADGLIMRVRPRLGLFSLAQFAALAEVSARFGDGDLHLTSRANVQIRGVSEEAYPDALDMLKGAGLVDDDAQAEAIRNIMVTPQVALCPLNAGADAPLAIARKLARAVEQLLSGAHFHRLPGKFGIAIQAGNEGNRAYLSDVTFVCEGPDRIWIILDGAQTKAIPCRSVDRAIGKLHSLLEIFLGLRERDGSVRRMRDVAVLIGKEAVAHQVRLVELPAPVGPLEIGQDSRGFGIGFAFGEISQAAASEIIAFMEANRLAELALAPQRALVFRCEDGGEPQFFQLAQKVSGIADPRDILMRMHACVGAPACSHGTAAARKDAKAVAHALRQEEEIGITAIHISGCEKRCACPRGAEITAVARSGRYDIVGGEEKIIHTGVLSADLPGLIAKRAMQP